MQTSETLTMNRQDPLFILETERLWLRRIQMDDVEFLVELWTDSDVTRYAGGPRDKDWLRNLLEETAQNPFAEKYDLWMTLEKAGGQRVGHVGLLEKEIEGAIEYDYGYFLMPSFWGRGYATEICKAVMHYGREVLGLRRMVAMIDPMNAASQNVALKLGMKLEREMMRPGTIPRRMYSINFDDSH